MELPRHSDHRDGGQLVHPPWGRPAGGNRRILNWTPSITSLGASMSSTTYEIRLRGHLPPQIAAALGRSARVVEVPAETVLRTARIDPAGVHELIDRLGDFGIELLDLRRCADGHVNPVRNPG
jgi:hypothetical protein